MDRMDISYRDIFIPPLHKKVKVSVMINPTISNSLFYTTNGYYIGKDEWLLDEIPQFEEYSVRSWMPLLD